MHLEWFALGTAAGKQNFGVPPQPGDSIMIVFITDNGEISRIIPRTSYPPAGSDKYSPTGSRYLYCNNKESIIYMSGLDTIFRVTENKLIPIWIIIRGKDAVPYNTNVDRQALAGKHDIEFVAETGQTPVLRKTIYADYGNFKTIIVDKQTNKAAYVNIIDDVFGFIKPEEFRNSTIQNNRMTMSWEAYTYLKLLKDSNTDNESLIKYSTNPERLRNISEDSNPVIITFNIKNHIRLK
ncbi:MAG TPA: hypothetical protein VHO50_10755 [Bacteroidales bacterium]|nr:hypothetical protein [Bacteroidales bacterium]